MSHTTCPHCASDIPPGFKFCGSCGQPFGVTESKGETRHEQHLLLPLIGRESELRQLVVGLKSASHTDSWIEIRGEPGIGKTRLMKEAAQRCTEWKFLTITPGTNSRYQPLRLMRNLVQRLLCEVTGQTSPPETPEAVRSVLGALGTSMTSFVDVFWNLTAPGSLCAPKLGHHLSMFRWSLERGLLLLLAKVAEYKPDLGIFFDAYELADEASIAILRSLSARPAAWPMPVVVASCDTRRAPARSAGIIQLLPLSEDLARELLARVVRGAVLPEALQLDLLRRAAGVPQRIEESVQTLRDTEVLVRSEDGAGWLCNPQVIAPILPEMHATRVIDRLTQAERELLSLCAAQGIEFDAKIAQAVQRLLGWQGSPVAVLLRKLERQGLVLHRGAAVSSQWCFSSPRLQEACYEALPSPQRRVSHGTTAAVLSECADEQEVKIPEVLSYHYERAEQWLQAATAQLYAGDRAAELFLNEEALRCYQRAIEQIGHRTAQTSEATHLVPLAYGGATRVHLRLGAFKIAAETSTKMRASATDAGHRAEADRLAALASFHLGRVKEAEHLLEDAIASAQAAAADAVLAPALADLTKLLCNSGRRDEASQRVQECRALATRTGDAAILIRVDILESDIAAAEGRFADAKACCARAYDAARRAENLSELARAHNGLGIAARDVGDYETAQHHFEQALEIWELRGEVEWIAGTYSNLGMLAQSRGDLTAATGFYERALAVFRAMGSVDRVALVQANLAAQALEEGDFLIAVTLAEVALTALNHPGGNIQLRGVVLAVLGEGRLECGDAAGALRIFDTLLHDYDEQYSPLVVAFAWRGRGRVALMRRAWAEALKYLERALQGFERLQRTQEAARTGFYRAIALHQMGEHHQAQTALEHVREQFVSIRMRAGRDAERAERLLRELTTRLSSS